MDIDFTFSATVNTQDGTALSLIVNEAVVQTATLTSDPTHYVFTFDDKSNETFNVDIKMEGKTDPDSVVTLCNLKFAGFELSNILLEEFATYSHNFNGYGDYVEELYTSTLGCNGDIKFTFTTPLYSWLLNKVAK